MTVTVFGGTGRTGRHIVQQALAAGHTVTLLVRNGSKAPQAHPRLSVLIGSFDDRAKVEQAVTGVDAVISALGPSENRPPYHTAAAMKVIVAAMTAMRVQRLIVTAGAGLDDPEDSPRLLDRIVKVALKTFARHVYNDMKGVVEHVRASNLEWTIVRAPRLTDASRTGRLRVGHVGRGVGRQLGRPDFAQFVVQQLSDKKHIQRAPAISN